MRFYRSPPPAENSLQKAILDDQIWPATVGRKSEELVIFVHGYAASPGDYSGLLEHFHSLGLDTYAPTYPADPFSAMDPLDATKHLANKIDSHAKGRRRILLCAHSMGCVFLKAAVASLLDRDCRRLANGSESDDWRQRADHKGIRILLLAGTNRGYKPRQRKIGLALSGLHHWFWLTLIGILWGNWLSWIYTQMGFLVSGVLALATAGVGLFAAYRFWSSRCFAWQGAFWATTMVAWACWGSTGQPLNTLTAPVAIIATTAATFSLSQLFGYKRGASTVHAALIASVVASIAFINSPMDITLLWPATLALILCFILYPWKSGLLLENVLQGSSWVSGVRLRWMEVFQRVRENMSVVHIFGDDDLLIDDDDYEELFASSQCSQFAISGGTHKDFMLTPRAGKGDDAEHHPAIRDFITGFVEDKALPPDPSNAQWRPVRHDPNAPADTRSPSASPAAIPAELRTKSTEKHVVILIHGIRDFGEWQDSLADRIRRQAVTLNLELLDVVVVRYGYFSAFQFLMSSERDRATQSFMDAYAQVRTRYPDSKVHVAAHSNGTFVVCNALSKPKGFVKLNNVYFAGSVVSPRFPWSDYTANKKKEREQEEEQMSLEDQSSVDGRIHSDCATMDWPVGALCYTLSVFGILNWFVSRYPFWASTLSWGRIGAGGVDGFVEGRSLPVFSETRHLDGDHGEAIRAKYHIDIANFLLTGRLERKPPGGMIDHWFRWLRIIFAIIGVAMVVVLYIITINLAAQGGDAWAVMNGALLTIVVIRILMSV